MVGDRIDPIPAASFREVNHIRAGDVVRVEFKGRGRRRVVPVKLMVRPTWRLRTFEAAGIPLPDGAATLRRAWLGAHAAGVP